MILTDKRLKINSYLYCDNQRKRQTRLFFLTTLTYLTIYASTFIVVFNIQGFGTIAQEIIGFLGLLNLFIFLPIFTIFLLIKWRLLNRKYSWYPLAWLLLIWCSLPLSFLLSFFIPNIIKNLI